MTETPRPIPAKRPSDPEVTRARRRRRVRTIRVGVVAASLAAFALAWGVIFTNLDADTSSATAATTAQSDTQAQDGASGTYDDYGYAPGQSYGYAPDGGSAGYAPGQSYGYDGGYSSGGAAEGGGSAGTAPTPMTSGPS